MKYFETLSDDGREALFAFMREIDAESDRYLAEFSRLQPRHGEIAVGAAHFDEWICAELLQELLRGLRRGLEPEAAVEAAREYGRLCVMKHNEKRRDYTWQRDLNTGQAVLNLALIKLGKPQ